MTGQFARVVKRTEVHSEIYGVKLTFAVYQDLEPFAIFGVLEPIGQNTLLKADHHALAKDY